MIVIRVADQQVEMRERVGDKAQLVGRNQITRPPTANHYLAILARRSSLRSQNATDTNASVVVSKIGSWVRIQIKPVLITPSRIGAMGISWR
jgi:hypothetical protein